MKKIGFIGAGNMATAIIDGIIRNDSNSADFITAAVAALLIVVAAFGF